MTFKYILKHTIGLFALTALIQACDSDTVKYQIDLSESNALQLRCSSTKIDLEKENATSHIAITFDWNANPFGINTPVSYALQIDNADGDFTNAVEDPILTNSYQYSYTDSLFNLKALKLNLTEGETGHLKARLKACLANEAEILYSNELTLDVTPYKSLVLKYQMPTDVYIQGDAVESNWGYPIPQSQKMVQIDDHRFALLINLVGEKSIAFLTADSYWTDPAYKAAGDGSLTGEFIPSGADNNWGGNNITIPQTGTYTVLLDFATGYYTVTEAPALLETPENLYIVGDATALGWAAPDDSQKFTRIDDYTFQLSVNLTAGKQYALITAPEGWTDPAYILPPGLDPDTYTSWGSIIASGAANNWSGSNMHSPSVSGRYVITVSFKAGMFVVNQ